MLDVGTLPHEPLLYPCVRRAEVVRDRVEGTLDSNLQADFVTCGAKNPENDNQEIGEGI